MEATAAILGIAQIATSATLQARKLCELWREAPRDVYHLKDELDTCKAFFESVQSGMVELLPPPPPPPNDGPGKGNGPATQRTTQELNVLLLRGRYILSDLQSILEELVSGDDNWSAPAQGGQIELAKRRKLLWLRQFEKVNKLKKMLGRTTQDVAMCLTLLNVQYSAALAYDARTVRQVSEPRILAELTRTAQSTQLGIERALEHSILGTEANIQSHIDQRIAQSVSAMTAQFQDGLLGLRREMLMLGGREEHGRHYHSNLGDFHLCDSHTKSADPVADVLYRTVMTHLPMPPPSSSVPSLAHSCHAGCRCACHLRPGTSRRSGRDGKWEFSRLQNVAGSLRISFSGIRLLRQGPGEAEEEEEGGETHCTDGACEGKRQVSRGTRQQRRQRRQQHVWIMVRYSFPSWLARAMMSVLFLPRGGPELLIRVHTIIPPDFTLYYESIFGQIERGDVQGVRSALLARPSAVHDVNGRNEESPLIMAISSGQVAIARVLLQAGADPFQETVMGRWTPARWALMDSMAGTPEAREMADLMAGPIADQLERDDFSELHRVLVGVLPIPLAAALANPVFRAQVNCRNAELQTPLHFAARFAGGDGVRLLLQAGAEVDALTSSGTTPLQWACVEADEGAAAALLAAGASVHASAAHHKSRWSLLHVASMNPGCTTRLADLLISHGVGVDAVSELGSTALATAAYANNVAFLRHLIVERGADPNQGDLDGDVPLFDAIQHRSYEAAEALLACGADYRVVNRHGCGVLHCIAASGDKGIMRVMSRARMTGLPDPRCHRNKAGKTAFEVLRERPDFAEDVGATFQELMDSVNITTYKEDDVYGDADEWCSTSDDGTADDFFDALEELGH